MKKCLLLVLAIAFLLSTFGTSMAEEKEAWKVVGFLDEEQRACEADETGFLIRDIGGKKQNLVAICLPTGYTAELIRYFKAKDVFGLEGKTFKGDKKAPKAIKSIGKALAEARKYDKEQERKKEKKTPARKEERREKFKYEKNSGLSSC